MGYNNLDALRFVIDIETAPLPDAAAYLEPAEPPSNYKDADKIAAYVREKNAENLSRAALDADLCRIVAIGWMREDATDPTVVYVDQPEHEESVLTEFWRDVNQHVTVGYNTIGFDLPILVRRSLYLGVTHPFVNLDKYRSNHIDLQQRLSYNGAMKFRSLSFYCKRFGIPCGDDSTGSQVGQLVIDGKWDEIAAHCRADVVKTKALAERIGLLRQQPVLTEAAF